MPSVIRRNVGEYINYAIVKFYSRIFLRKLDNRNKVLYRSVEAKVKSLTKLDADLEFLRGDSF